MNVTAETIQPETGSSLAPLIHEALERLRTADGALTIDLSGVRRLDPAALPLFEQLAAEARDHTVRLILSGVSVAVYKVLKLSGLASQFSFLP
jgi:anti-anti-sigma factor